MKKTIEVNFDGGKFKFANSSLRASFLYEEIAKKSSSKIENLKDNILMIYCLMVAHNKETFQYTFDEFVEILESTELKLLNEIKEAYEKK